MAAKKTGLNSLRLLCVTKEWQHPLSKVVHNGFWGNWKPWAYRYSALIVTAGVWYEDSQGNGDDSALNAISRGVQNSV